MAQGCHRRSSAGIRKIPRSLGADAGGSSRAIRRIVTELARQAPRLIGSPVFFIGLLTVALLWIVIGPLTGFSNGWALIPSA